MLVCICAEGLFSIAMTIAPDKALFESKSGDTFLFPDKILCCGEIKILCG